VLFLQLFFDGERHKQERRGYKKHTRTRTQKRVERDELGEKQGMCREEGAKPPSKKSKPDALHLDEPPQALL
jgi:hypothetical protein